MAASHKPHIQITAGTSQVTRRSQLHGSGPHGIRTRLPCGLVSMALLGLTQSNLQPGKRRRILKAIIFLLMPSLPYAFLFMYCISFPARCSSINSFATVSPPGSFFRSDNVVVEIPRHRESSGSFKLFRIFASSIRTRISSKCRWSDVFTFINAHPLSSSASSSSMETLAYSFLLPYTVDISISMLKYLILRKIMNGYF